ncbi:MAG TPA: TIGR04283 family arsenosugar biosynthesis glycosyltransferase [Aequorivita sp.]|nr:TIGR04283 family arsenosugar biosynthesis glycosyltransferase [Aequorivita sp.]
MLSIIIPVLNEATTIKNLLTFLSENSSAENEIEILVVDGGSYDGTRKIIAAFAEKSRITVKLIASEKGRAKQMNKGAQEVSGEILYFLHADSFPPKNFDKYIVSAVKNGNPAGCFRMKFDSNHWWLKLTGWFTRFNWQACRGGDQSQFITKNLFDEIGGFDESYIIYEDNILINELYKRKKFVVIPQWLTTSERLYRQKGVWTLQFHFLTIYAKRFFGADADELYNYYLKNIKLSKKRLPHKTDF